MFGDWKKARDKIFLLRTQGISRKGKTIVRGMGRRYLDTVRKHIIAQDLNVAPLAAGTVEKKGHSKWAIDNKRFLRLLKLVTLSDKKHQAKFAAGALQSVKWGRGRTMLDVAKFFNDGTRREKDGRVHSPQRPIFTITLREILRRKDFPIQLKKFAKQAWTF